MGMRQVKGGFCLWDRYFEGNIDFCGEYGIRESGSSVELQQHKSLAQNNINVATCARDSKKRGQINVSYPISYASMTNSTKE